ncbi:energy transducer TonB [Polaribacter sp. Hel1_85]|uniref:energy transducer TonB n=1 Tax=Polaribacter sp. Hel1_85 TaxID=1250005 RepID=UPI00052C666D|nr:energy transducer TonB [Polaribacter sp. Hel1_85]KGL62628.1 TonB [Polaribacter sp. Hel1_85]
MKNTKKLPTKQLEKFSNIFTQLGLVLVLFIVYVTLEHQTVQKTVAVLEPEKNDVVNFDPATEVLFTKEPKAVPKVKKPNTVFIFDEPIKKGDDNIIEISIDTTDETPELIDLDNFEEIIEPENFNPEDEVDFINIQNAPVFKGCENLSKEKNKRCFDKKMKQFVTRNFDIGLANELGLHAGKHKIQTQFVIDDKGEIVDVKIRTAYKALEKEANRIIKKLPKFKPGKQNSKTVKVRYNLPISFRIE